MSRPSIRLAILLLLFYAAVVPLAMSVQAGHHPRDVPPDRAAPTNDGQAIVTDRADSISTQPDEPDSISTQPDEPDSIFLKIEVYGNGTAHWRVEYWIRLDDRTSTREFRQFQRNVQEESVATSEGFYDRTRRSIGAAEDATGREMSGTDFDTRTTIRRIPQKYGLVVYSFRWQGFASVSDQHIRAGDALEGLFLGSGEHLVISWPDEYAIAEVTPTPDVKQDTTAIWHGPTTFGIDGPRLLLVDRSEPLSWVLPFGTVATVVALVAVLTLVRRSDGALLAPHIARVSGESGDESELLSNEERVLRLLEEHGGRLKQQEVTVELGWTESKTSYVVSNLREEGRIYTFRLGQENVLSLSDSPTVHQPKP